MTFSKKAMILSLTTIAVLALAACSNGNSQTQPSQASQANSSVSSSSTSTSTSASSSSSATASTSSSSATTAASTELDGTYTATHEGDQLTLTISSGKGTLTTLERDGEKEIEQVEIDSTNQRMIIGDDVHRYYINGNQLTIAETTEGLSVEETQKMIAPFLVISRQEYEKMTGKKVDLADNEALLYAKNLRINQKQALTINGKSWNIKEHLTTDFAHGKIVNPSGMVSQKNMYMVVNNPSQVGLKSFYTYYIGIQSSNKQVDLQESIFNALQQQGQESGNISLSERYHIEKEYQGVIGTLLFIGIFLSTIFLLGTVLVIYYKQISEGYEDREGFIILQKVGLDEKQTKATIRKQILTVFFLPLIFAFLHIAVAFHMLQLIVALLGATNILLLIQTTITTCGVFLLVYILVFVITSRSYQKIVAR